MLTNFTTYFKGTFEQYSESPTIKGLAISTLIHWPLAITIIAFIMLFIIDISALWSVVFLRAIVYQIGAWTIAYHLDNTLNQQ